MVRGFEPQSSGLKRFEQVVLVHSGSPAANEKSVRCTGRLLQVDYHPWKRLASTLVLLRIENDCL
jgi:hypothetical protein